jgi:acyl-CoA synthetase (NDP forming)
VWQAGSGQAKRLKALFAPRRIVLAGLSTRPDSWGRLALNQLRGAGFPGEIVALRPRQLDPTVPSISQLDDVGATDLLVVALPAEPAVEVVAEAASAGMGAAVVFASGFAEAGPEGTERQSRLVRAAGSMPVLGPNCLGLVAAPSRMALSTSVFLDRPRPPGPVALVSQSGALGFVLADRLRRLGIGFSYFVSTGNEACLDATEVAEALLEQDEVALLGLYLEGIRDIEGFRRTTEAARLAGIPVVALSVGRSPAAARATLSHTAAAATEPELWTALCRRLEVVTVPDEEAFADAVAGLLRPRRLPAHPGLGVLTMSGGAGALIADRLGPLASIPALTPHTRERLRDTGVPLAGDTNPVDLTGMFFHHLDRIPELAEAMAADPGVDALTLYVTFGDRFPEAYHRLLERLATLPVPAWMIWAAAPEGTRERLPPGAPVVDSIPALARVLAAQPREPWPPASAALNDARRHATASSRGHSTLPSGPVLTELDLAPVLASFGLPFVPQLTSDSAEGVVAAVERAGWRGPLVLKVDHPEAPHRTRRGLIALGVDLSNTEQTAVILAARAQRQGLSGFRLVAEPQVPARSLLGLGALRHERFGPVLLLGRGGQHFEEPEASRTAACLPLDPTDLAALVDAAERLGCDVELRTLAGVLVAVEQLLLAHEDLAELDCNPIVLDDQGRLLAVDALGVRHASTQAPQSPNLPRPTIRA